MEGRLVSLTVTEQNKTYTIEVDAIAGVPLPVAWRLLTDYPNLGLLNDSIKKSEILGHQGETEHLLRVNAEAPEASTKGIGISNTKITPISCTSPPQFFTAKAWPSS